jgi:PAS domain S-box-containing protein
MQELSHPDEASIIANRLQRRLAGEIVPNHYETIILTKDGSKVPVEINSNETTWKAQPAAIVIVKDITARKQSEETLLEAKSLLQQIVDGSSSLIYLTDEAGRFLLANDSLASLLGETPDQIRGKNRMDYLPKEIARQHQDNDLIVLETGEAITVEEENQEKDGKHIYYSSKFPVSDSKGHIYATGGISTDITDRKHAETLLRESEQRYHSLFENMLNGFAYCKMLFEGGRPVDFIYIEVNKAFETLTGLKQVAGKKVSEVIPGILESDRGLIEFYGRVALGGTPEVTEIYVEALKMWFSIAVYSPQEEYFVAVFDVITERKRAETAIKAYSESLEEMVDERTRELREAQERLVRQEKLAMLGQLGGSVSHELRNPLGVISNAVYFLNMSQPDADTKVKQYLEIIENETRTANKIITDLLDFSRITSVNREPVSVADLVNRTLVRYPVPESINVTLNISQTLPPIHVDLPQMMQVLGNLVVNACQAMTLGPSQGRAGPAKTRDGGRLVISAVQNGDRIVLAVKDTGVGIPPENMTKLFEPLFTTKARGIGLGLAICKNLMEANGGMIEVQSKPGKGSVFTLLFPIYKETK